MSSPVTPSNHNGIYILDASKRCESNAFLFTKTINFFLLNGYGLTNDIHTCSTILVNSCCVSEDKISSSLAALEYARPYAGQKQVILLGCLATLPTQRFNRDDLVCIGPKDLNRMDSLFPHKISICDIPANQLNPGLYEPGQGLGRGDYFVLIAQGCVNECSYCNIKRSKGWVKSEPLRSVLSQIRHGLNLGVKEFSLIADDCGSYGHDTGSDFVELLHRIFELAPDFTIKLLYLYPDFLSKRFANLEQLFQTGRIVYVHIPIQSGSQRILDLMERRYLIENVADSVRKLRRNGVRTVLCTHVLINFPTETREEFLASLAVADAFDDVIILQYSDNLETPAALIFPKVSAEEAHRRLEIASGYINHHRKGNGFVINNFDCTYPYNLQKPLREG